MTIITQYNVGDTIYYPEVYVLKPAGSQILARAGKLEVKSILINVNQNSSHSVFYKDDGRPCISVAEQNAYATEETALDVAKYMLSCVLGEHNKSKTKN